MLFSIILILLVGVVAFFHYLQGFLSAAVSAIIAAISVLIAFTYYEPIVTAMNPGKFADSAHAMMLVALFAATYIILRIIFDKAVPGNVRVPAIVDKVGAGVMGLVVGCLAGGLLAVAAQALPFGPSVGGYARYRVKEESSVQVYVSDDQQGDRKVYDEVAAMTLAHDTPHESLILLPMDDIVLGFVYHSSDGGSTAGRQPFARIHPDYLQELFGNRIGIEQGAKRSAQPISGEVVDVLGVYKVDSIPQFDGELDALRIRSAEQKLEKVLRPTPEQVLLVVRMQFKLDASDDDKNVRVSPGTVRLVTPLGDSYRQYHPVGTVENGTRLYVQKPDDFLFVSGDKAADFLFVVDAEALPDLQQVPVELAKDSQVFIEAKRYGRVALAGKTVDKLVPSDQVSVLRKKKLQTQVDNASPDQLRQRLLGSWDTTEGSTAAVFTYNGNGDFRSEMTKAGKPLVVDGKWKAVPAPTGLMIEVTGVSGGGPVIKYRVDFTTIDQAALTNQSSGQRQQITRKK